MNKLVLFFFFASYLTCSAKQNNLDMASNSKMYKTYANYYDNFYQTKNYEKECAFLNYLFSKYQVKTILDVGCGTGSHLSMLEQFGYSCEGLDFNQEMLEIAKRKLQGKVFQANMRNFELNKTYDAIISLFAVFNHNLNNEDAINTLTKIKSHLKENGILILDLYNPQSSGKKCNTIGEITKIMEWEITNLNQICESTVSFYEGNKKLCEEKFPLKVYSIEEMKKLLEKAGFNKIHVYNNFEFEPANSMSKNLIFVAQF